MLVLNPVLVNQIDILKENKEKEMWNQKQIVYKTQNEKVVFHLM